MQCYVVFRDTPAHFFKHILKKGFQHCYILIKDDYNWVRVDPRKTRLCVEILPFSTAEYVPAFLSTNATVIQYVVDDMPIKTLYSVPTIMTCVTLCKYVLGLRGFKAAKIITPWQLYKYIKNKKK